MAATNSENPFDQKKTNKMSAALSGNKNRPGGTGAPGSTSTKEKTGSGIGFGVSGTGGFGGIKLMHCESHGDSPPIKKFESDEIVGKDETQLRESQLREDQ